MELNFDHNKLKKQVEHKMSIDNYHVDADSTLSETRIELRAFAEKCRENFSFRDKIGHFAGKLLNF